MSEFLELFELHENNNNQLLSLLQKDLKDDIQSQNLSQGPLKDNHSIISDNNNIFISQEPSSINDDDYEEIEENDDHDNHDEGGNDDQAFSDSDIQFSKIDKIPLKLPPGFTQKDVDLRKFYYKYECFSEVQLKDCIEKLNINSSQTTDLLETDSTNSTYESIDSLGRAYSSSSLSGSEDHQDKKNVADVINVDITEQTNNNINNNEIIDIEDTAESIKDKVKTEMISESPLPSTPKTYDFTSFPRSSPTPPPTPPLSNYVPRSDYTLKNKFKNINIPMLLDSPSCNLSRRPNNNYYYNNNNNEDFIPSKKKLFQSTLSDNIDNIPSSNFKDLNSGKPQQQTRFDNNNHNNTNGFNIPSETFQSFILGNDINQNTSRFTINKDKSSIVPNPLSQENLVTTSTPIDERSDVSVVIESQVTTNKISPAKDNEIKSLKTRSSSVSSTSTTSATKSHVKETLTTKSPITRSSSSAAKAFSETSGHAIKRTRIKWTVVELEALEEGMKMYGTSWTVIHEEFGREDGPLCNRDPAQLKDKARTEKKHRIKHGIPLGIFKKATGGY